MKHIVIAVDLAKSSEGAIERAVQIAADNGAALHAVHCTSPARFAEHGADLRQQVRDAIQPRIDRLPGGKPFFSVRIRAANPEEAILAEARRIGADLIILGAHGEPRFRDAVFGTTATHIVRHSDRPVLVVQNDAPAPYGKAMVALADLSGARPVIDCLLAVAPAAETWAVHAFSPTLRQIIGGRNELDRQERLRSKELAETIKDLAAGRARTEMHAVAEAGDAFAVLMKEATDLSPDLLVMGTRGRSTFLGSYAVDALFWCTHDVLIVPEAEPAAEDAASVGSMVMA